MAFTLAHRFTRQNIVQDAPRRALLADWADAHPEDFRGLALPSKRPSKVEVDELAKVQGQIVEFERKREDDRKYIERLEEALEQAKVALVEKNRK